MKTKISQFFEDDKPKKPSAASEGLARGLEIEDNLEKAQTLNELGQNKESITHESVNQTKKIEIKQRLAKAKTKINEKLQKLKQVEQIRQALEKSKLISEKKLALNNSLERDVSRFKDKGILAQAVVNDNLEASRNAYLKASQVDTQEIASDLKKNDSGIPSGSEEVRITRPGDDFENQKLDKVFSDQQAIKTIEQESKLKGSKETSTSGQDQGVLQELKEEGVIQDDLKIDQQQLRDYQEALAEMGKEDLEKARRKAILNPKTKSESSNTTLAAGPYSNLRKVNLDDNSAQILPGKPGMLENINRGEVSPFTMNDSDESILQERQNQELKKAIKTNNQSKLAIQKAEESQGLDQELAQNLADKKNEQTQEALKRVDKIGKDLAKKRFKDFLKKQALSFLAAAAPWIAWILIIALAIGFLIITTVVILCKANENPLISAFIPQEIKQFCGDRSSVAGDFDCPSGYVPWRRNNNGEWKKVESTSGSGGPQGPISAGVNNIPTLPYSSGCRQLDAFLRAIIYKESVLAPNPLVPGPEGVFYWRFPNTPYAKENPQPHPDISEQGLNGPSNAAGAFQFLSDSYYKRILEIPEIMNGLSDECKNLVRQSATASASRETVRRTGLECVDFSPVNQTRAAFQYLKILGVPEVLCKPNSTDQDIAKAVQLTKNTWASLPGGPQNDPSYTLERFIDIYKKLLNETTSFNLNQGLNEKIENSPAVAKFRISDLKNFFSPIYVEAQNTISGDKIERVRNHVRNGKIVDAIKLVNSARPDLITQISAQPINPKTVDLILAIADSGSVESFRITSLYRPENASAGHREGRALDIDQIKVGGKNYTHLDAFGGNPQAINAWQSFGNFIAGTGIDYLITAEPIYSRLVSGGRFTTNRSDTSKPYIQNDSSIHADHFHIEVGSKPIFSENQPSGNTETASGDVICCPPGVTPNNPAVPASNTGNSEACVFATSRSSRTETAPNNIQNVTISSRGQSQLSNLVREIKAGLNPNDTGRCYFYVAQAIDRAGGIGNIPPNFRFGSQSLTINGRNMIYTDSDALQFAAYLNKPQNLESSGMRNLFAEGITNPNDSRVPPGAIIVIYGSDIYSDSPVAARQGDINVKSDDGRFLNYGNMSFMKNINPKHIAGIYIPK